MLDLFGEKVVVEEEQLEKKHKVNLFDIVSDINYNKKHLIRNEGIVPKDINTFIVSVALANSIDNVMFVNDMNQYSNVDNIMFYDYLINSIRQKKRFDKWVKANKDENINNIMEYFQYSYDKACAVLSLFSEQQLKDLKLKIDKGGLK